MGSRTDNLTIRLGQKPYFELIPFRSPLGARNGCAWRISVVLSYANVFAGSSLILRHEEHILASLLERRKEKIEEAEEDESYLQKTKVRGVRNAWQLPRIMTIIPPLA